MREARIGTAASRPGAGLRDGAGVRPVRTSRPRGRGGSGRRDRLPPEDGAPVEVLSIPGTPRAWLVRVSPDGKQIAFLYQEGDPMPLNKLAVASVEGGPLQFTSTVPIGYAGLGWAPSGKALQYLLTRNGATNLWEQPLPAGEPRQITNFSSGRIFDFAWARDGRQFLLTKGNQTSDVILIRNFR